jgi:alkyl hydroperoxide reductase subunit AhpF
MRPHGANAITDLLRDINASRLRGSLERNAGFDLIVVGAGVAGLTAALFAARHGLKVTVGPHMPRQIGNARIENFPASRKARRS